MPKKTLIKGLHPATQKLIEAMRANIADEQAHSGEMEDALVELAELFAEQDDALVELAELIEEG